MGLLLFIAMGYEPMQTGDDAFGGVRAAYDPKLLLATKESGY